MIEKISYKKKDEHVCDIFINKLNKRNIQIGFTPRKNIKNSFICKSFLNKIVVMANEQRERVVSYSDDKRLINIMKRYYNFTILFVDGNKTWFVIKEHD